MNTKRRRLVWGIVAIYLVVSLAARFPAVKTHASEKDDDPMIVVSLGDSYSAGEGIPPFYGDNKVIDARVRDYDWLAHRSINSWPSKLVIPGYEGPFSDLTLGDYRCDPYDASPTNTGISVNSTMNNCQWYFAASTGATTENFNNYQTVEVRRFGVNGHFKYEEVIPPQRDIFSNINGTVDYVTLTMGGNDVGFSKIMETAAIHSDRLFKENLLDMIDEVLHNLDYYREKFKVYYNNVINAAPEADIIVVGYPQLLDLNASLVGPFSGDDVIKVNASVETLNLMLQEIVDELDDENKIHFVDVQDAFKDHQAYSADPWINGIMPLHRNQDHDDLQIVSSYSMHPNEKGAEAYAQCVNLKIQQIEETKKAARTESGQDFWIKYINEYLVPEKGFSSLDSSSKTVGENWNYPSVWDKRSGILSAQVADLNNDGIEECVVYYFDTNYVYSAGGNLVTNDPKTTLYAQVLSKNSEGEVIKYEKRQIFISDSISFCDAVGGLFTLDGKKYVYFEVNSSAYYSNVGNTMYSFFTFDGESFRLAYAVGKTGGGSSDIEYALVTYDENGEFYGFDVTTDGQSWYQEDGNYSKKILWDESSANRNQQGMALFSSSGSSYVGYEAVFDGLYDITNMATDYVQFQNGNSSGDTVMPTFRTSDCFSQAFQYNCNGSPSGSNGARKMKITVEDNTGLRKNEIQPEKKEKQPEKSEKSENNEYILSFSSDRYLTDADLDSLSEWELKLARNEIYARHGRRFKDPELQAYFDSKSWYKGIYDPQDFDKNHNSDLSDLEKKNAEFILKYEKDHNYFT